MNRERDKSKPVLSAPEQAIDHYLAALLSEVAEYQEPEARLITPPVVAQPTPDNVVAIRQGVQAEALQPAPVTIETGETADTGSETAEQAAETATEIVPEWAEKPFQCLPFSTRGMKLVVPLTALSSITEWDRELSQIPGQPDWHRGILMHRDQRVVVVDIARLIMPDRLEPSTGPQAPGSHILIIGDGRWGIACDRLLSPLQLDREAVRWRRGEGYRPWMAGTVIDQLSVLLNVDVILEMIRHNKCSKS